MELFEGQTPRHKLILLNKKQGLSVKRSNHNLCFTQTEKEPSCKPESNEFEENFLTTQPKMSFYLYFINFKWIKARLTIKFKYLLFSL